MAASNSSTGGLLIIERILRDRDSIWRQIGEERDLGKLTTQMLASSAIALACYGAVLGASHSIGMSALSAVKLPLLFLMTLAICLPTLYLFNLVFGARLQVRQALALVMVTVTVTSVLSLAFAPIALFFRITAHSYTFYKILNVAILTLTAVVGLKFLTAGMRALNEHTARRAKELEAANAAKELLDSLSADPAPVSPAPQLQDSPELADKPAPVSPAPVSPAPVSPAPGSPGPTPQPLPPQAMPGSAVQGQPGQVMVLPNGYPPNQMLIRQPMAQPVRQSAAPGERPASMTLLYVWILLFGFVGTQLAWTLRPFIGSPGEPFQVFREIDGNFYVDIVRSIGHLF